MRGDLGWWTVYNCSLCICVYHQTFLPHAYRLVRMIIILLFLFPSTTKNNVPFNNSYCSVVVDVIVAVIVVVIVSVHLCHLVEANNKTHFLLLFSYCHCFCLLHHHFILQAVIDIDIVAVAVINLWWHCRYCCYHYYLEKFLLYGSLVVLCLLN